MKKWILLALSIGAMGLAACSGSGGGSGGGTSSGPSGAGGSISDIAAATSGWTSVFCKQGTNVQNGYLISSSSGNVVISTGYYDNGSNCNSSNLFRADRYTYSAATNGTNGTETTATNLNLTISKIEMMATTAGTAADFNTAVQCGKNNWVAGQWIDVSATSCGTSYVGTTYYTIFRVSGNNLYLGTTSGGNDGTAEAKRHTSLDNSNYYSK